MKSLFTLLGLFLSASLSHSTAQSQELPKSNSEWVHELAAQLPAGVYPGHTKGSGKPSLTTVTVDKDTYRVQVEMSGKSFRFEIAPHTKLDTSEELAEIGGGKTKVCTIEGEVIKSEYTYGTYGWKRAWLYLDRSNSGQINVEVLTQIGGSLGAGGNDTVILDTENPSSPASADVYEQKIQGALTKIVKLISKNKAGTPAAKRTVLEFEYYLRALESGFPEQVKDVFNKAAIQSNLELAAAADTTIKIFRETQARLLKKHVITRRMFLDTGIPILPGNKLKIAFIDADSTLRVSKSGSVSANAPDDVEILPDVADGIAKLNKEGYLVAIVSNQNGVESGHITLEIADRALNTTIKLIRDENSKAVIHYFDFAEKKDEMRKPDVGMAKELERRIRERWNLSVDYDQSLMIGDSAFKKGVDTKADGTPGTHFSNSDRLFAQNLGVRFIEAAEYFGWRKNGVDVFETLAQVDIYRSKFKRAGHRKSQSAKAGACYDVFGS